MLVAYVGGVLVPLDRPKAQVAPAQQHHFFKDYVGLYCTVSGRLCDGAYSVVKYCTVVQLTRDPHS